MMVVWERATGKLLANAIVWQGTRPHRFAQISRERDGVTTYTGPIIDPVFLGATKLAWLLRHVPGFEARALAGEVCFGTVHSFLSIKLTGGRPTCNRLLPTPRGTMMYDIRSGRWHERLLFRHGVPRAAPPEVCATAETDYALIPSEHFGAALPIMGVAGDQRAAAYGQACVRPRHVVKATYGSGCFVLANTGEEKVASATHLSDDLPQPAKAGALMRSKGLFSWPAPGLSGSVYSLRLCRSPPRRARPWRERPT